jgi:hypothetical protein
MYTFKIIPSPYFRSFAVFGDQQAFEKELKEGNFHVDVKNHSKTLLTTSIYAADTSYKVNREVPGIKQKFYSTNNYFSVTKTEEYLFKITKTQRYKKYKEYLTAVLDRLDVPA